MSQTMRAVTVLALVAVCGPSLSGCDGRTATIGVQQRACEQSCVGEDQACTPAGECEARCDQSMPCDGDQVCHPTLAVCVECVDGSRCDGDQPFCDPLALRCVECRSDLDCGGDQPACVDHRCVECFNNTHCAVGERCNPSLECVDACTNDSQCEDELPHCNTSSGECEAQP